MSRAETSRHVRNSISRALAWGLMLASIGLGDVRAQAPSFDYVDSADDRITFNPGHLTLDASGAWVVGNATARFGNDGALAFLVPVIPFGGDALLAETIDGGVAEAVSAKAGTPFTLPCAVTKLDAHGGLQWTQIVDEGSSCALLDSDDMGTLWIATEPPSHVPLNVYRVDADGSGFAPIAMPSNFVALAAQTAPRGLNIAGYDFVQSKAAILQVDGSGSVIWEWQDTATGSELTQIGSDAAHDVIAAGVDANQQLIAASVTQAGALRWRSGYDAPGADAESGFAAADDGSAVLSVPSSSGDVRIVEKIAADGTLLWQNALPMAGTGSFRSWLDGHMGIRLAPNGDVLALMDSGNDGASAVTTELFRLAADGTPEASTVLTGRPDATAVDASAMVALADSSALVTTRSDFVPADGAAVVGGASANGLFLHIDAVGQVVDGPLDAAMVAVDGYVLDANIADDGTTYLATQYVLDELDDLALNLAGASRARYALSRIAPDGTRLWKIEADGFWQSAQVTVNGDRVCIGGNRADYWLVAWSGSGPPAGGIPDVRVECRSNASGAVQWSTVVQSAGDFAALFGGVRGLDDTTLVATYMASDGALDIASLDAGGAVTTVDSIATTGFPFAIGADGSTLVGASGTPSTAMRVRPGGTPIYATPLPNLQTIARALLFDDGGAALFGQGVDGSFAVTALSAGGNVLWSTTLADPTAASALIGADVNADAQNVFAILESATGTELVKLERTTGSVDWRTPLGELPNAAGLAIDPRGGSIVYNAVYAYKIGVQRIDRNTGALDAPTYTSCLAADCSRMTIARAAIGSDAILRYVLGLFDPTTPAIAPVHVVGTPVDASAAHIPIAQPGIDGAWYAPYDPGQGFLIDYIASNGTLFVPWFTYSLTGGDDPANLNWFSLQGDVAAADSSANLVIFANEGGAFATGTTDARAVGTASLAFADCDHGSLHYRFDDDVNGGATGDISLVRLTPSGASCTLSDGTVQPADFDNPARNGFDENQSGSWYDPRSSGQGIEFAILPQGATYPGLLFGAWFTYDPADAPDDPTSQHWFTLQGDLSGASAGRVTAGVYATIGGTLDGDPGRSTFRIGQATIAFDGCTSATIDYTFDDSPLAHAYSARTGHVDVVKLGGCAP